MSFVLADVEGVCLFGLLTWMGVSYSLADVDRCILFEHGRLEQQKWQMEAVCVKWNRYPLTDLTAHQSLWLEPFFFFGL